MKTYEILKKLSDAVCVGEINEAEKIAAELLSRYCEIKTCKDGTIYGFIDNKKDKTLLIDAHIDEIAMTVLSVSDKGFLKVAKMGGIDPRMLPAMRVKVWGKEVIKGVFGSTPPHIRSGNAQPDFDSLYIDTGLGAKAKELIPLGSIVSFDVEAQLLENNRFTGKSIDNRASVSSLIKIAEIIAKSEKPRYNVAFLLSRQEELGLRGAQTSAFEINPDECIVVDVTFGNLPGIPSHKTGVVGKGPMIGISPILSKEVTEDLKSAAYESKNNVLFEIMGSRTSTNADVISISRSGVKTGLISIPIRNMHTPTELVAIDDIDSTAEILAKYIEIGGKENA